MKAVMICILHMINNDKLEQVSEVSIGKIGSTGRVTTDSMNK